MKIIIQNPEVGAIKITRQQAIELGINPDVDQQHGEMKTIRGPWQIPVSYKALCLSRVYNDSNGYTECTQVTFYGMRTMTKPRQAGYFLDGRVSIDGKKYSAFTSSQLFEIDGKLIDVATIHARI